MLKPLFVFIFLSYLIACAENLPDVNQQSNTAKPLLKMPILISANDADLQQINSSINIDEDSYFVISDTQKAFDNTALIQNQNIRSNSRAIDNVSIKTTGVSQITKKVYYMGAQVFMYSTYDYDMTTGMRTQRTTFNGPGLDADWFTADDDISNYAKFDITVNNVQTHYVLYDKPGVDGIWLNGDDNVKFYMADLLDANGGLISVAHFNSSGVDASWFTLDDSIQWTYSMVDNADGSSEWVQYRDAGIDLDWITTADNTLGHFSQKTVGTNSKVDRHTFYIDAGLDGIKYTDDDSIGFYHNYVYNAQDFLVEATLYRGGAGVDNIWFTSDDILAKCELREANTDGTLHLLTRAKPGVDESCFSLDDEITSYDDHIYDNTGHLTASNLFGGPGVDGLWYTVDDSVVKESTFLMQ